MKEDYKEKIFAFWKKNSRMPGYQEIMALCGFKSKNAVYKLINSLVKDGVLKKDTRGKISPKKMFGEVPVLGLVEAGIPTDTEQNVSDTMSLDEYLIDHPASSYMLEVKGDSMIDAGIHEGDMVIVERKRSPKAGDIVIAEVDGGWTMKFLRETKNGSFYLEPANKKYKPIYPEESMRIAAVVRAVVRKY